MKKLFLLPLLFAATTLFAETRVETFTPSDNAGTATYVTEVTSKVCDQATWSFFSGGIRSDVGNFGSYAAVIRAKKSNETDYAFIRSSSIEGGIDSLWFEWNSNGNETAGMWNIKIYINDVLIDSIYEQGIAKIATGGPFREYHKGNLGIHGDFTIKLVNESPYTGTGNFLRFVLDNLSWTTNPVAGEKVTPEMAFESESLIKMLDAAPFINTLTTASDGIVSYESSNTEVATVNEEGEITIVGVGITTITASIAESETYKAAAESYTLRVVPLNFHLETFDGAQNVDITTNGTYLTTPAESFDASSATGIKWTTLLGSVRNALGGSSTDNFSAVIRAKKDAEADYGYLLSSTIAGGIDSLAFDWNSNGTEASRTNPWNIKIYINDVEVGAITDVCQAMQPLGSEFRYSLGNLKVDGDFTLKFVNMNVPDDGSANQYRFVIDNIEWYSYAGSGPGTALEENAVAGKVMKQIIDGQIVIIRDGIRYNATGQKL
jgi:hypothetical protein